MMSLNNRLKEYRMQHGISQKALGKLSHISRQTVSQIECGSQAPSVSLVLRLVKVFHCSAADLFE